MTDLTELQKELIKLNEQYQSQYTTKSLIIRDYYSMHAVKPNAYRKQYISFTEFRDSCLIEETDQDIKIREYMNDINLQYPRTYFITSAIAGDNVNKEFLKAIKLYCEKTGSILAVIPMRGVNSSDSFFPEEIRNDLIKEYVFNNNITAIDLSLHPQQFTPLSQINRLGKEISLIIAHPKMQMETSSVELGKLPHILHSTGSVSNGDTYTDTRPGKISKLDHTLGGLILEIVDEERFHIRQITFDVKLNGFYDLNVFYGKKIIKSNPGAIYMGDIHSGYTDELSMKATYKMINELNIPKAFVGDFFDGSSISHHMKNDMKAQVNIPEHINTLEKELDLMAVNIQLFLSNCPKTTLYLIEGNHENVLPRYLKECRYQDDRINHLLSLYLAIHLLEGRNPIEEYVRKKLNKHENNRVIFLNRQSSHKIGGVELALHGDKTVSGLRGGADSLEKGYTKAIFGHFHSPKIFRGIWIVGTLSKLVLPYTDGYSTNWLNTNAIIFENGQRQLLNIINGEYRNGNK